MNCSGEVSVEMPEALPTDESVDSERSSTIEEHAGKKLADIRMGEFIVQAILALSLFLFACINLSVDPKGVMSNFWIAMISPLLEHLCQILRLNLLRLYLKSELCMQIKSIYIQQPVFVFI